MRPARSPLRRRHLCGPRSRGRSASSPAEPRDIRRLGWQRRIPSAATARAVLTQRFTRMWSAFRSSLRPTFPMAPQPKPTPGGLFRSCCTPPHRGYAPRSVIAPHRSDQRGNGGQAGRGFDPWTRLSPSLGTGSRSSGKEAEEEHQPNHDDGSPRSSLPAHHAAIGRTGLCDSRASGARTHSCRRSPSDRGLGRPEPMPWHPARSA